MVLKTLAIQCALQNDWQKASAINQKLLQENPYDIDALNRLAFSYMKLGKFRLAKSMYKKVIEIDKTNPIATKNLKKLNTIADLNTRKINEAYSNGDAVSLSIQDVFIEEAGKTKTLDLKNVADRRTLSLLQPGDVVKLIIKRSKIFVQNSDARYIGMLPDNVGTRLIAFMKGGNEYQACIKALDDKNVSIFIKETSRAVRFKNQPSFTSTFLVAPMFGEES